MNLTVDQVSKFQALLTILKDDWTKIKSTAVKAEHWFVINHDLLSKGWQFVFSATNKFVALAAELEAAGVDKKAVVLACINQLFDFVVAAEIPLVFQPMMKSLRDVFDAAINGAIEQFVTLLPVTTTKAN